MPDYAFTVPQVQPVRQSSLADMLTMARGAQAYQQEQQMNPLELQAKQMQVEQAKLMNPELYKAQVAATQAGETGAKSAALGLQNKIAQVATDEATSALNDPRLKALRENPEDPNARKAAMDVFLSARDRMINRGVNKHDAEMHVAPYLLQAGKGNPNLADELLNALAAGTGAAGQQAQANLALPQAGALDTGAGTIQTTTTPSVRGSLPTVTAGPQIAAREVPPTTQLVAQVGDNTGLPPGTPYLVGPRGPTAINAPKPPPMTTGLAPQIAGTLTSSATAANDDWKQTLQTAQMAPQRIAVFQNIKKLAPESFTGVGGERKALLAGLAQSVGISAFELEKTATDELIKNTKLLAIAGGNTDAARQLAEVANPNSKMTLSAIKGVADQLIGVEKMNTARFNYLMPFREDPSTYQQKMAEFTPLMDSRLYQEISPAEFKKLVNSMSAADKADISNKIKLGMRLGVIK